MTVDPLLGTQKPQRPKELSLTSQGDGTVRAHHKDSVTTILSSMGTIRADSSEGGRTLQRGTSESCLVLDDFRRAVKGFVPLSLRGLSLHSSGSVGFENVGGLAEVKLTLRETLQWPHKVLWDEGHVLICCVMGTHTHTFTHTCTHTHAHTNPYTVPSYF